MEPFLLSMVTKVSVCTHSVSVNFSLVYDFPSKRIRATANLEYCHDLGRISQISCNVSSTIFPFSIMSVVWLMALSSFKRSVFSRCSLLNASRVACLLYTSDAADEEDSVDLGGRRII